MMASLYAGVSGLKNHQVKMNVIGNNIANVNTIGYKSGRVSFQEALVQTFKGAGRANSVSGGTNPLQLGLGMQVAQIDNLFLQGGLETTGQITDLSIQGSGFFVLGDNNGNRFYTRAGAFGFDGSANLVDPSTGLFVMGRMADSNGIIPAIATTDRITLPFGQQDPARATTVVTLSKNIDSSATNANATLVGAGSSNVSIVSGTAVNGVGGQHVIDITGTQPTQSQLTQVAAYVGNETLGSLGITDFNFSIAIDGGTAQPVPNLNASSTINQLVAAIDQIPGITGALVAGDIVITRDKAGASPTFQLSAAAAGNITQVLFGGTINPAAGTDGNMAATDIFTPGTYDAAGNFTASAAPLSPIPLTLTRDASSGLVTGITGLGGGGVTVESGPTGFAVTGANDLVIRTEPTQHSTSINVFDSLGSRHTVSLTFSKSATANRWEWTASMLGTEQITSGGSGYVIFNSDGSLNTFGYNTGNAITISPNNGAGAMTVQVDAGTPGLFNGLTGFASGGHTAALIGQDGYGLGILEKVAIDQSGVIAGIFSNGVTRTLAQIMLADFTNYGGLRKAGRNYYGPTANSGDPVEGISGQTIAGSITSGALESSSVDIAQEFTSMITAQRGFQANARIITTSDNMLDELVNLKR